MFRVTLLKLSECDTGPTISPANHTAHDGSRYDLRPGNHLPRLAGAWQSPRH